MSSAKPWRQAMTPFIQTVRHHEAGRRHQVSFSEIRHSRTASSAMVACGESPSPEPGARRYRTCRWPGRPISRCPLPRPGIRLGAAERRRRPASASAIFASRCWLEPPASTGLRGAASSVPEARLRRQRRRPHQHDDGRHADGQLDTRCDNALRWTAGRRRAGAASALWATRARQSGGASIALTNVTVGSTAMSPRAS